MTVEACRKRREYLIGVKTRIEKELEQLNIVIKADNRARYEANHKPRRNPEREDTRNADT